MFATLEVDLVKPVTRDTLTERYAKYYGVTLDELIDKLAKRYPEDDVLYVVMFHIIKKIKIKKEDENGSRKLIKSCCRCM